MKVMSIRLQDDLHERVATEAGLRNVSMSWLIAQILREGIDRLAAEDTFTVLS